MQNITEKIITEAKKEAKEITEKFQEEAKDVQRKYEEKLNTKRQAIESEVEKLKTAEMLRTISKEKLFINKELTLKKQEYINEIIRSALKDLPEHKGYLDFLKALIIETREKDGELFVSKHDLDRYGAQLKKFIADQGLNYKIIVDNNITGGLILKKEKRTYIGSLDLISELLKDNLAIVISKILYK